MESLSQLLFSDASLLPSLTQLAEHRAAHGGGGSGGVAGALGMVPEEQQEQPSLLVQLLRDFEQQQGPQFGGCGGGGAGGSEAGLFDAHGVLRHEPSWIPTAMFTVCGDGWGARAGACARWHAAAGVSYTLF